MAKTAAEKKKPTAKAAAPAKKTAAKSSPSTPISVPEAPPAVPGAKKVHVHYLTRVEGHGNIVVDVEADGTVSTCRWEVPEAPRFFEAMLVGRDYRDVHHIVSRICGICAIGHQLASLQATEDALNIHVSEQTHILRRLALHAENMPKSSAAHCLPCAAGPHGRGLRSRFGANPQRCGAEIYRRPASEQRILAHYLWSHHASAAYDSRRVHAVPGY
jgi:Coenzyme F420-reducing hydrogenase, alpha subunit